MYNALSKLNTLHACDDEAIANKIKAIIFIIIK